MPSYNLTLGRLILFVVLYTTLQAAENLPFQEYQVKGAFLLNFAAFVEWPPQAFKERGDPITVCVLGQDPFGPRLVQAAKGIVMPNRILRVRQVTDARQASECQIVFVCASERKLSRALLEAVKGESVLTVGESEGFLASGGIVVFTLEGDKVRIAISKAAADRARLQISAKLLSLGQAGK